MRSEMVAVRRRRLRLGLFEPLSGRMGFQHFLARRLPPLGSINAPRSGVCSRDDRRLFSSCLRHEHMFVYHLEPDAARARGDDANYAGQELVSEAMAVAYTPFHGAFEAGWTSLTPATWGSRRASWPG